VVLATLAAAGCNPRKETAPSFSSADSATIIQSVLSHRDEMDDFFRNSAYSPFNGDTSAHFSAIKWYPPTLEYYFRSKLNRYPHPETVIVLGTKGEERRQVKFGYFTFSFGERTFRLNAYKDAGAETPSRSRNLAVWFTDSTTNRETYGVGRYLDVGDEHDDADYVYTLDFNNAYNPYCAYSSRYSCAIPRQEDRLDLAIRAGELKYHP
jgi:hypothetical protein